MVERRENQSREIDFIKNELIPEMVHNRCFCEAGSREFVEFESASVVPSNLKHENHLWNLYEAKAVIKFSGEASTFSLLIKILSDVENCEAAYNAFLNEEMFYSKMRIKYELDDCLPKCYASDMGRYSVPVIVLENLVDRGYERIDEKLNERQLKAALKVLAVFHGKGLKLKDEKYEVFREFYAKLLETTFDEESTKLCSEKVERIFRPVKRLSENELSKKIKARLSEKSLRTVKSLVSEINDVSTICHGHFSRDNLLFKRSNDGEIDVRMIDWQTMRYSSPAIDLATILFPNLPSGSNVLKQQFVDDALTCYLRVLNRESNRASAEITLERLKREIISKSLYGFILSLDERSTDEELIETLLFCDSLGVFD